MVSNIHMTVVSELNASKPRHRILNDLMVSFCALSLDEIKNCDENRRAVFADFVMRQLELSACIIESCADILESQNKEKACIHD